MNLQELSLLRTAPSLNSDERGLILGELQQQMSSYMWFTVGIMACSAKHAVQSLREVERVQNWSAHELIGESDPDGPVYLKANQQTLTARLRVEHGLGEGILISGHGDDNSQLSATWGPLPLNFFAQQQQDSVVTPSC